MLRDIALAGDAFIYAVMMPLIARYAIIDAMPFEDSPLHAFIIFIAFAFSFAIFRRAFLFRFDADCRFRYFTSPLTPMPSLFSPLPIAITLFSLIYTYAITPHVDVSRHTPRQPALR